MRFISEFGDDRKSSLDALIGRLHEILESEGLRLNKTTKSELISKLRKNEKYIYPFTNKLSHFINKAQQKHLTPEKIDIELKSIVDEQERAFVLIANKVYKRYESEKKDKKFIDFNQILKQSSKRLNDNKCDIDISVGDNILNLKDIKYLIIDEYQDFSTLFYMLLEVILKYNKDCRIFVVGDSWQSINAFAGSELGYFFDFRKLFNKESTSIKKISKNYRSKQAIVEMGNNLMDFEGTGKADWLHGVNDGGEPYKLIDVNKFDVCNDERILPIWI